MLNEKSSLHPRNIHRQSYDFEELMMSLPALKHYVFENKYGTLTINFNLPKAVKLLNKALLIKYYQVADWDIPDDNLCPPIPGRADYVHYLADLLAADLEEIPTGLSVKGLDVGVGANLVYPLIAYASYGWQMLGTDVNQKSLDNAHLILEKNPKISSAIKLKLQTNPQSIFKNIIAKDDRFAFTMCNPPFYDSEEAALKSNLRKTKNLKRSSSAKVHFNFSGQQSELWCDGGELAFISKMIKESVAFSTQVLWFTSLVSKKENLYQLTTLLKGIKALEVKIIDMAQGQKTSRILAWTFIPQEKRKVGFYI